jgi:mono/diheme cytochrome c family protein
MKGAGESMANLIGAIVVLLVVMAVGLLVMYAGWYDIGATAEHNSLTLWIMETTMENSVEHHAKNIDAPELADSVMVARGFEHFEHSCITCHGAPGINRAELAVGLYPEAPDLTGEIDEWSPSELFWITWHGIKLSGMPAFVETHSDEEIWDIVAFLQVLPDLGRDGYLTMRSAHGPSEEESTDSGGASEAGGAHQH